MRKIGAMIAAGALLAAPTASCAKSGKSATQVVIGASSATTKTGTARFSATIKLATQTITAGPVAALATMAAKQYRAI